MRLFEGQRDLLASYFHHLVGLTHSPIRFMKLQHKNKVLTRSMSVRKCSAISLWYQKMSLYPNSNDSTKAPDRMDGWADKTAAGSSIWLCSVHIPLQLFLRKYCCMLFTHTHALWAPFKIILLFGMAWTNNDRSFIFGGNIPLILEECLILTVFNQAGLPLSWKGFYKAN